MNKRNEKEIIKVVVELIVLALGMFATYNIPVAIAKRMTAGLPMVFQNLYGVAVSIAAFVAAIYVFYRGVKYIWNKHFRD